MASWSAWKSASVQRRKQWPGRTRPARPARCAALALLTGATSSDSSPEPATLMQLFTPPNSVFRCQQYSMTSDAILGFFLFRLNRRQTAQPSGKPSQPYSRMIL